MTAVPSRRTRTAPPLHRGSMAPSPWFGFWRGLLFALWPGQRWPQQSRPPAEWHAAAHRPRAVLLALVAATAGGAAALRLAPARAHPAALWWATPALMPL